ncbi:MAG: response regulator [Rhodocyclaceae bacterium]|nr:response regulator [Rhodocyclaceae bacterium]MBX3668094.1 response regulator [Rhodocyclaceae bacterium]
MNAPLIPSPTPEHAQWTTRMAAVAHDLRTPICGMLGMVALMEETRLLPEQAQIVRNLRDSAEFMLAMANDLLDFARLEYQAVHVECVPFRVENLVAESIRALAPQWLAKRVEVIFDVDPAVPAYLAGDPVRIRQVLANLLANAIKFTPDEEGEIVVAAKARAQESGWRLIVAVRDNGIGIAPERQRAIFEPFEQAEHATHRLFGGSGLGLAICRRLLALMGGSIAVESEPGAGSTFTFDVLCQAAEAPAAAAEDDPRARVRPFHALVVDDNPRAAQQVARLCERLGGRADIAQGGEEARIMLVEASHNDLSYDVLLVDRDMPQVDGFKLAEKLYDGKHALKRFIMAGGAPNDTDHAGWLRARGVRSTLCKPYGERELAAAILQALSDDAPPATSDDALDVIGPIEISDAPADKAPQKALRVLLVEDNAAMRDLSQRMLLRMGYRVSMAFDGREALAKFRDGSFDIILMDVRMPGMDGITATGMIRDLEMGRSTVLSGDLTHVPILGLTAAATPADVQNCIDAGMDDVLIKPVDFHALAAALARACGGAAPAVDPEVTAVLAHPLQAQPAHDNAAAREVLDGDVTAYRSMIALFLASLPEQLRNLGRYVEAKNYAQLESLAHDLKSISAALQLPLCRDLASRLELSARKREGARIATFAPALRRELEQAAAELRLLG